MTIDAPVGSDPAQMLTILPQIVNQANTDIASAQATADAAPTLAASGEVSPTKAVRADDSRLGIAEPALVDWRDAYQASGTSIARLLVIGDSITEGTGASTLSNRWQTILQTNLRRHAGVLPGATYPFIPTKYQTTTPGQPSAISGTTSGIGYGFGWRTIDLKDDTSTATFTFTGTSAKIMYVKGASRGVMAVSVDGAAPTLVNTNGPVNIAAIWDVGALSAGPHTLTVTRDPSSAAGQTVWLEGLLTYNGDEAAGVRIIDGAKAGISASQLTQTTCDSAAVALKAAGPFAAVLACLGTNDYANGVTLADFKAAHERLIASLRGPYGGFSGSIILLNTYKSAGRDEATWDGYSQQLAQIAAGDSKIAFVDLRANMPDIPSPYTDVAGQGMFADTLHPSDVGHRHIAGVLTRTLTA